MSLEGKPIFETLFNQSAAPAVIFKANGDAFETIAQNAEYERLNGGKVSEDNAALIPALHACRDEKKTVKLPAVNLGDAWLQTAVSPILEADGSVNYLSCVTYSISDQLLLKGAAADGSKREHDLAEELAASNEELSAANEELLASNEELLQSQDSLLVSNRDLEERVKARTKDLSASEARFRTMVEQSPVPMLVTMGQEMVFEVINQPMLDLIGKDASVVGKPWHEAMPELEGQDIIGTLLDTYDSGQSWLGNEVPIMIYKTGAPVLGFYNISYKPLIENGRTIGMLQSAIDVTDLVKSRLQVEAMNGELQTVNEEMAASNEELAAINEELHTTNEELNLSQERLQNMIVELAESDERFRNMAESSEVLIAVGDENGKGVYFNKAWSVMTGKTEADLLESGWAELIHPEDKARWLSTYLEAASRREPVNGEFRIRSKAGDYRWLLANIPARFRPDGSFAGHISSCIDITERKINEQQLEQIINILPASVVVIRGEELIVEAINEANLNYWNKTKDEVIGKSFLEILPDLAGQAFAGQLRQVIKTGEIVDVKESPVLFTNPDGTQRETFVDYTYQPLTDAGGNRTGVLVMSSEITDRVNAKKQLEQFSDETQALNEELTASNEELAAVNEELLTAQQTIEEREASLRLAIDAAEFGTWFIHSVTREFITDARLKELFGYYEDEPLSIEGALAQITEEYRGFVAQTLENAIYNNGDYDVTYPVIGLHDEKLRWLRAIGNLKADASGAFSAFTGVVMDITEAYLASRKIEQAEENLRMATESGELATWYLDEKLGKITASARFNELFGFFPDEEVPYSAAVTQIVPEYRQQVLDAVTASFTSGANFNVEYPIIGFHDQKQRWIRSVGKFVADEKNGNYITGVMADITEQKNDELRKNDFIGMVSHELKTPLTSLTAIIQVLNAKLKKSEDAFVPGALEKANVQVKKMSTMINGFLNVSRLESGKIQIDKQNFIIGDLVREVIEETNVSGATHIIDLETCDKVVIHADREKIGSVISNLLSNAVKYSPKGSGIRVQCRKLEQAVEIRVTDEGLGIRPEDQARLFDRFYRVESNHTRHISGFGIGLYLSAEIVERHGGRIGVESQSGIGSTFYFTLPLSK